MWIALPYAGMLITITCVLSPALAQPDSTRYLNGLTNRYKIEYYRSDATKSIVVQNVANKLKKPNYSPDELSMKGLDLKRFQDSLTVSIQNLFPASKWSNLPKGYKIALELAVLKSGEIAELLLLVIPNNPNFSGIDIEQLESLVKHKTIRVTDLSLYSKIDFMPLFFTVTPVK